MTDTATAVEEREAKASRSTTAGNLIVKLVLVGLLDALLIISIATAVTAQWWLAVVFFVILLVAVNGIYLTRWSMPLKYLLPGLAFMIVFQVYTMFFTGYASFTNYGSGHLDDKAAAIIAIQQSNVTPVEGSPEFAVAPLLKDGQVSMLVTDPTTGQVSLGTNDGLTPVNPADVQMTGTRATGLAGYTTLTLAEMSSNPDYKTQWDTLRPPVDKAQGTYLRANSITKATIAKSGFVYDEAQNAMIAANGEVYQADEQRGNFMSPRGEPLNPGWRVMVGPANYVSLFTDETIRSRFLPIAGWTFFFAIGTTFLNFAMGLLLALVLNERRMRGQKIYRLLLIIPYGLPGILTTLVWKGMLNTDFGLINQILGAQIPWLTDPWLAKFSILMVNLWMGFPYFFLVCSGALTAIPADLKEAAFVDGASGSYAFRTVVLPLLLVATAPLLVTTFAFNFNNYTLIEMLTRGGPFSGSIVEGGATDLLINYTFRTAFNPANQQLGLASAIAMVIFLIVGGVSAYGFRLTKRLEEMR